MSYGQFTLFSVSRSARKNPLLPVFFLSLESDLLNVSCMMIFVATTKLNPPCATLIPFIILILVVYISQVGFGKYVGI